MKVPCEICRVNYVESWFGKCADCWYKCRTCGGELAPSCPLCKKCYPVRLPPPPTFERRFWDPEPPKKDSSKPMSKRS